MPASTMELFVLCPCITYLPAHSPAQNIPTAHPIKQTTHPQSFAISSEEITDSGSVIVCGKKLPLYRDLKSTAYKPLVLPQLEYASTRNTIQILFIQSEIQNSITLAMNSYIPTYKLRQVYIHASTTHIIS